MLISSIVIVVNAIGEISVGVMAVAVIGVASIVRPATVSEAVPSSL